MTNNLLKLFKENARENATINMCVEITIAHQ